MYLRVQRVRRGEKSYEYHQLCRSVRKHGKPTCEVVCHLGRLAPDEAQRLARSFGRLAGDEPGEDGAVQGPWVHFGGPLLVRRLLEKADLVELFGGWQHPRYAQDIGRWTWWRPMLKSCSRGFWGGCRRCSTRSWTWSSTT
jgi:hypothetical protein